jgi:hypothetical protein
VRFVSRLFRAGRAAVAGLGKRHRTFTLTYLGQSQGEQDSFRGFRRRRRSRAGGVLIVAGVYLVAIAAAAGAALAARSAGLIPPDSSWWPAPVAVAVSVPLGLLIRTRITRRHVRHDVVECATRSTHSRSGKWHHGRVQKVRGELVFRPGGPVGMRFPLGKAQPFPVVHMSEDQGRRPALRQIWSINPTLHIVEVVVGEQKLELAALPDDLERLREMASTSGG